jgi:hypothetical protein
MLGVPSNHGVGDQKFCTPARAIMGYASLRKPGLGDMQDFAWVIDSVVDGNRLDKWNDNGLTLFRGRFWLAQKPKSLVL